MPGTKPLRVEVARSHRCLEATLGTQGPCPQAQCGGCWGGLAQEGTEGARVGVRPWLAHKGSQGFRRGSLQAVLAAWRWVTRDQQVQGKEGSLVQFWVSLSPQKCPCNPIFLFSTLR